jgi:hypothetical protein
MVDQRLGQSLQSGILSQMPVVEVVDATDGLHSLPNDQIPRRLAGATSDGPLYFSAVTDEGIRISKIRDTVELVETAAMKDRAPLSYCSKPFCL